MLNRDAKLEIVNTPPAWMYEWDLGDGVVTPTLGPELTSVHTTRAEMIAPVLDRIYPNGLDGARCLDVACNEGWFSHMLYERGASVRGTDIREMNINRAVLIRDLYRMDKERLEYVVEDFFENDEPEGSYEVTFFLGLLYHIEDPMHALRKLCKLTRTVAFMETQLTRQLAPIDSGWGVTGSSLTLPASIGLYLEPDMEVNNLASLDVLSFIPNAAAVDLMMRVAGFSHVEMLPAEPHHNPQYVGLDRGVFAAYK